MLPHGEPLRAEQKQEKERAEFVQAVSESTNPIIKQAVAEHVERELKRVEGEPHGTISQNETERYLNTDWDSARLAIQSKLTQYHQLPDKSSDEAVKLERAVLEDMGRVSGNGINTRILEEEGARLLIERGDVLADRKKFEEFTKINKEDADKLIAFFVGHGQEIDTIGKLSKGLGLKCSKLAENRDELYRRLSGK